MDIRRIEYFIEVAEMLNFNKAASQLHISHQALSKQIQLLERELGVKLMERSTTRVTLTEAGTKIYGIFKPIMRELELGCAEAREYVMRKKETLRIGYFNGLSHNRVVEPIVRRLEQHAPQLHIDVLATDIGLVKQLLEEDSIDLAVFPVYGEFRWEHIICLSLSRCRAKIIVSENHPWFSKEELTAQDIRQGTMLICENRPFSGKDSIFPELQAAKRVTMRNYDTFMNRLWRDEVFGIVDDTYSRREGNYKLFDLPDPYRLTVDIVAAYKKQHPLKRLLTAIGE